MIIRCFFFLFVILFSCNTKESNLVELSIIKEKVIEYNFIYEINEISEYELSQYCCDKKIKDLVFLQSVKVAYINLDGETQMGELIVHHELAEEVVDIFRDIYECRFPIEKMTPINLYDCNDDKSMEDNNTSAFNYRTVSGSRKLSDHSFGRAIDINPLLNPYIRRSKVQPENGRKYTDRENHIEGMIQKNDCVVQEFKSRGWQWGGDWKYSKDYQHFYKY
ncbi:MAG: M15 family metallopeptidase [Flavobacteriales bacterium]